MNFSEFANKLYKIISARMDVPSFVAELFENITVFKDNKIDIVDKTSPSSFKKYYTGERGINFFAKKIRKYIEPAKFEDYITNLSDEAQLQILTEFSKDCPEMTKMNVAEKLADLFKSIIIEAVNEKRRVSKKKQLQKEELTTELEKQKVLLTNSPIKQPVIKVVDAETNGDKMTIYRYSFSKSDELPLLQQTIINQIKTLQNNELKPKEAEPSKPKDEIPDNPFFPKSAIDLLSNSLKNLNGLNSLENVFEKYKGKVEIPAEIQDTIDIFARCNGLKLTDNFWNMGELKKTSIGSIMGGSYLLGTKEEEERYWQIYKLSDKIKYYRELQDYYRKLDELFLVEFAVVNLGTSPDEDIDIKLIIKQGNLVNLDCLPIPGLNIIEMISNHNYAEALFKPDIKHGEEYANYSFRIPTFKLDIEPLPGTAGYKQEIEKLKSLQEDYLSELKHLFCYKYYKKDNYDILEFHIDRLKHNMNMLFPSILAFKSDKIRIDYEIRTQNIPEIIKGTISSKLLE